MLDGVRGLREGQTKTDANHYGGEKERRGGLDSTIIKYRDTPHLSLPPSSEQLQPHVRQFDLLEVLVLQHDLECHSVKRVTVPTYLYRTVS